MHVSILQKHQESPVLGHTFYLLDYVTQPQFFRKKLQKKKKKKELQHVSRSIVIFQFCTIVHNKQVRNV